MKKLILEAWTDDETGELGLIIADMPKGEQVNSGDSELIAHDVIEHINGPENIGSIADECEALGALWMTRGKHGELSRKPYGSNYSPVDNVASDVTRMFRDWFYNREPLPCPKVCAFDYDEDFDDIIEKSREDALGEFDDEDKRAARELLPDYLASVRALMVKGARKSIRKYGDGYAANNLFWAVAEAVEPFAKPEFDGQRFALRYGFEKFGPAVATVEEIYEEDIY